MAVAKLDIYVQKNEIEPSSYFISKWVKYLRESLETIKPLEEDIGEKLDDIDLGNDFLDMTLKIQASKVKAGK